MPVPERAASGGNSTSTAFPPYLLYHRDGSYIRTHCFHTIVTARSRQEAAQVGFDRADEEAIRLRAMSVCTMTLPEGRAGIMMCNDDARCFRRRGRWIVEMISQEVEAT